ncbi:hypothetical protein [Noviherbaspirillum denitrificans]|uniref:Uncharacterized protein n=1 Tax=Noviherbaspirillum denitrificans TaxID=1968433 RepID=A0A254TID5_9BURK|nr:hypothetical protein [Noviherbaspirillum denitrificans]OWW22275.1 hypothetical protein AYR66_25025 [Noviherbaspirillum denitrificans]
MFTLKIKDLSTTVELDHSAMATVRGGYNKEYAGSMSLYSPGAGMPQTTSPAANTYTVDASQLIGQAQNVTNNNGNCVAFANCISSTVNPTQTGHNNISF